MGGRGRDEGCGKWVEPADLPTPQSLNRIKSPSMLDLKIKFECKRSTRLLSVGIIYSMPDLICDIINYCASSFATRKIKCI